MSTLDTVALDKLTFEGAYRPEIQKILFQRLAKAWRRLTARQRQVVTLVYGKGFSEPRAARRLGISRPMVAKHRQRALRKIAVREVAENREW